MRANLVTLFAMMCITASTFDGYAQEWSPSYLGCMFTASAFSASDNIYPDRRNEKRLEVTETEFEMAFAAIDLVKSRAQLIGNQGATNIVAYRGGYESLIFLEWTPAGNVNLTTVLSPAKNGTIRAITSRHIAEPLGGFMASQFLGTCKDRLG